MGVVSIKQGLRLSLSLAIAEFKERTEGSYLGIFWYLLNPLLMFLLLLFIFSDRLGGNIPHYPLYLLLGIIMFNLFQQTTRESTRIIRENRWLIKSINFPREILVGSVVLKFIFSHLFEIILISIILLIFDMPLYTLVFYPIILLFLSIFICGACLILSSLTVYFIDLENIWLFTSLLIWLGTPIFYSIEGQTRLFLVNLFNPMYYFITIAREIIVYQRVPPLWLIVGAVVFSLLSFLAGALIFGKLKPKFAEMI